MIMICVGNDGPKQRVTLDQGVIMVDGVLEIEKTVEESIRACYSMVGNDTEHGDPDYNVAMALIEQFGGKVLKYEPEILSGNGRPRLYR
jgi:hypothetical protein